MTIAKEKKMKQKGKKTQTKPNKLFENKIYNKTITISNQQKGKKNERETEKVREK